MATKSVDHPQLTQLAYDMNRTASFVSLKMLHKVTVRLTKDKPEDVTNRIDYYCDSISRQIKIEELPVSMHGKITINGRDLDILFLGAHIKTNFDVVITTCPRLCQSLRRNRVICHHLKEHSMGNFSAAAWSTTVKSTWLALTRRWPERKGISRRLITTPPRLKLRL
ncbi:putative membrane protein C16E9.09c [Fusarium oxysporum f. sp. albedinis]|nr:putative membrane protein C16E9.09c [Fusarium oxysporum f. sp. albedinis]